MKHKHWRELALYAKDAAETDKPWERWEFKREEAWVTPSANIAFFDYNEYRRKPQEKIVDLSVLISSGVDCTCGGTLIGKLTQIIKPANGNVCYVIDGNLNVDQCRPRMNHWHAWRGGDCPLPEGLTVDYITAADGRGEFSGKSEKLRWAWARTGGDIIAFKVTGLAEGWVWPFEEQTNDN